jgi:seryl-tRNA synthetase
VSDPREAGFLIRSGAQGIYGAGDRLSRIIAGLKSALAQSGDQDQSSDQDKEVFNFPPVMARADLERIGYFRNFPHLLGLVSCFCGDEHTHRRLSKIHDEGGDWTEAHQPSDLVLTPAACYPVYPALAARGPVPPEGYTAQVCSFCFRHEPSPQPTRLRSFEMLEFVRIGSPEQVLAFRQDWLSRGRDIFEKLQLPFEAAPANDPFFGRAAAIMQRGQKEQELKTEFLVPINEGEEPTACMSVNVHRDHFATALDIRHGNGGAVHSACAGFGLARIAFALLRWHGASMLDWPASTRAFLGDCG